MPTKAYLIQLNVGVVAESLQWPNGFSLSFCGLKKILALKTIFAGSRAAWADPGLWELEIQTPHSNAVE